VSPVVGSSPLIHFSTVSALELGNIKVWLTLGEIEGTKIPILNPETSVPDKTTKGTVYFERWSGSVGLIILSLTLAYFGCHTEIFDPYSNNRLCGENMRSLV